MALPRPRPAARQPAHLQDADFPRMKQAADAEPFEGVVGGEGFEPPTPSV